MKIFDLTQYDLPEWIPAEMLTNFLYVVILLAVGIPVLVMLKRWVQNVVARKYAHHYSMLSGRLVFYIGLAILLVQSIKWLGFDITPILGAAGIVGIALGFASQTSVSNLISGIFLIAEQPFKIGDIITVNTTTGVVLSVDLMSVKLRTFDNKFVRIPNESLIKNQMTNNTKFDIRRVDATIGVAYKEDLERVKEVLRDVAEKNEFALKEPEPLIIFDKFGTSSIDLLFLVWTQTSTWLKLKNTLYEEIKAAFDREGIEIPFPHVTFYTGQATKPLPLDFQNGGFSQQENPDPEQKEKE